MYIINIHIGVYRQYNAKIKNHIFFLIVNSFVSFSSFKVKNLLESQNMKP